MGMMDDVMDNFDDEAKKKAAKKSKKSKQEGKSIEDHKTPMTLEEFLSMAEGNKKQKTPQKGIKQQKPRGNTVSDNPLRPMKLSEFIGQDQVKTTLNRFIDGAKRNGTTMPHTLLATGPGRGKTTLACIIANELDRNVFVEQAPISINRLAELGKMMTDGDVLIIDEVHLQAYGRTAANRPEALYGVMEDKKITTEQGVFNYPDVCIIGCTTDLGLLPKPFIDRFVLKPVIKDYTGDDMKKIADMNAKQLGTSIDAKAKEVLSNASQTTPRIMNKFVKQADLMQQSLGSAGKIDETTAKMVLENEHVEPDGLTFQHMEYLRKLWTQLRWIQSSEQWVAKASLKNMTYQMGLTDTKYIEREIEPLLIKMGLIRIAGSREMTDNGAKRIGEKYPVAKP